MGEPPKNSPDPLIGQVIGQKYRIVEKLGKGSMGVVYKAEQTYMDREVALKILHPDLADDPELRRRFQQEAKAASRINHPNAITLYDFGIDGNRPYLAMKYVRGKTIKKILREQGPFPLCLVAQYLEQIGGALSEAHSLGVIHRDLKPDNIMISQKSDGSDLAEVLDFGIAKILAKQGDPNLSQLTQAGMIIGTPQYMSPEQAIGKQLDSRSDIYSLGIVLYEMLLGDVPLKSDSLMEMLMQQINDAPPSFCQFRPESTIPGAIENCVLKAISKDPANRQQSIKQLVDEFTSAYRLAMQLPEASDSQEERTEEKTQIFPAVKIPPAKSPQTKSPITYPLSNLDSKSQVIVGLIVILLICFAGYQISVLYGWGSSQNQLPGELSKISISSAPMSARVRINGFSKGKTPLLLESLSSGRYTILISKRGYLSREYTLEVSSGKNYAIDFPLKEKP